MTDCETLRPRLSVHGDIERRRTEPDTPISARSGSTRTKTWRVCEIACCGKTRLLTATCVAVRSCGVRAITSHARQSRRASDRRTRARCLPVEIVEVTRMTIYESWQMPRGILVVAIHDNDRAHAEVFAECITIEEAETQAAELNAREWLAARPADVPVMEWHDDWTERLLAILDKPYELELQAAA
jgi:hypothetical protein